MIGNNADSAFTIRLIGVDAPDTANPKKQIECLGPESREFTRKILLHNKVTIAPDETQDNIDENKNMLRYVYIDGGNYNKMIIENGFAREYTARKPYKLKREFKEAENKAQSLRLGIWRECIK